jgi:N-acetylmuramoyl-L-alanine amidase
MRNGLFAIFLLWAAPSWGRGVHSAEQAYLAAKKAYAALKKDSARRKRRDAWQLVARKFEGVAQKYPKSPHAAEALYTAAQLLGELSRISFVSEDLDESLADYQKLLAAYPRQGIAEDAALGLARAQLDRLNKPEAARSTLERGLRDRPLVEHHRLQALLSSIPLGEPQRRKAPPGPPAVELARERVDDPQAEPERPVAMVPQPKERLAELARHKDEVPLADQLGLKVRRVVIDPGHGGHDSGTVGPSGVKEKDVSLGIAQRLGKDLEAAGLDVVLTREDDRFVRLEDRAKIANDAKGDLFISIHCNSAPQRTLRGIETYTLNTASDQYSIRLAARENASTERGISDLQFILADLATKANTEESARLADHVQKGLLGRLGQKYSDVKDLGRKQALFYVLLGAKMPAILVEASFLSNVEDEKRLASKGYQEDVAQAIAAGVQDFLGYRQRIAKMD